MKSVHRRLFGFCAHKGPNVFMGKVSNRFCQTDRMYVLDSVKPGRFHVFVIGKIEHFIITEIQK